MPKPKPVPVVIECDTCGLPWEDHGDDPTVQTCVKLLKAAKDAAELRARVAESRPLVPTYVPMPYRPYYDPHRITWTSQLHGNGTRLINGTTTAISAESSVN